MRQKDKFRGPHSPLRPIPRGAGRKIALRVQEGEAHEDAYACTCSAVGKWSRACSLAQPHENSGRDKSRRDAGEHSRDDLRLGMNQDDQAAFELHE